jgi:hypothetical protein
MALLGNIFRLFKERQILSVTFLFHIRFDAAAASGH